MIPCASQQIFLCGVYFQYLLKYLPKLTSVVDMQAETKFSFTKLFLARVFFYHRNTKKLLQKNEYWLTKFPPVLGVVAFISNRSIWKAKAKGF